MKCQATKVDAATVQLPSQSPDGPYQLCADAAQRLEHLALRPSEWFNLATIHGPFEFYLHDDFYDEDGTACQPKREVLDPELFPCPTLNECAADLEKLTDFALTRWSLKPPVLDAFQQYRDVLLEGLRSRFGRTRNRWFHEAHIEIAGNVLGQRARQWFLEVIQPRDVRERLRFIRVGYKCLPHDEGIVLARESLAGLPKTELAQWCQVLSQFRDPSALDWIEANIHDPLTGQWGDLAAVSSIEWNRLAKWLQIGRPMSLVALDALIACSGPHPNQSFLIQKMQPRLHSSATASIVEAALAAYAARDSSPRVSKAIRHILANLPTILSNH